MFSGSNGKREHKLQKVVADNVYFGDSKPSGGQDNANHGDDFQIPEGFDPGFADQL